MPLKTTNEFAPPIDLGTSLVPDNCRVVPIREIPVQSVAGRIVEINGVEIAITTTRPNYGGVRYWFRCPYCRRRCGIMYIHPFGHVGCRICLNLTYPRQRFKGMLEESILTGYM